MSKLISLVMSVMLVLTGSVAWTQSLPSAKPEQVGLSSERLERVGQGTRRSPGSPTRWCRRSGR